MLMSPGTRAEYRSEHLMSSHHADGTPTSRAGAPGSNFLLMCTLGEQ